MIRYKIQDMSINSNIAARLCNHCRCGKAMFNTYSECVFLNLGTQHAMCKFHILVCVLSGTNMFLHIF
jgi:hypothetical protein